MSWIPLKNYSTFSLLRSSIKPEKLVNKCKEYGYSSLAITELGNLFSSVKIYKLCKASKIKPILGCDFYIKEGEKLGNFTVLAKNQQGWKNLIKAVSESNKPDNFDKTKEIPTINIKTLCNILGNECVVYAGAINSLLSSCLFTNIKEAIKARSYDVAKSFIRNDWEDYLKKELGFYKDLFGSNFYLENQRVENTVEACLIVSKLIDWAGSKLGIKVIGTCKPNYLDKEDAEDQRILLCSKEQATLRNVQEKIEISQNYLDLLFFRSSNSFLISPEQANILFRPEEIANVEEIVSLCSEYEILNQPKIPQFNCPNGLTQQEYLKKLCNEGWQKKIVGKIANDKIPEYLERVRYEMGVIEEAGLQGYFLVMEDIVGFAKKQGWLVGESRGSCGGSLVSHLTDITDLDPIEHGLLFDRFYNKGRNQPGKISLPDIDSDFPVNKREKVINYIKEKYGKDCVAQMATFGRIQGRTAIKDVLRIKERCSFEEMNKITEAIPDESKIMDELQEMKEAGEEPSIIMWSLENNKEKLKQWCYIDEKGELAGDFCKDFAQAIRLEGLKRQQGKHASGIVVANEPLNTFCPLLYDKTTGEHCIGIDMNDAESVGVVKIDILGCACLDNLMDMISIINTGDYEQN